MNHKIVVEKKFEIKKKLKINLDWIFYLLVAFVIFYFLWKPDETQMKKLYNCKRGDTVYVDLSPLNLEDSYIAMVVLKNDRADEKMYIGYDLKNDQYINTYGYTHVVMRHAKFPKDLK